MTTSIAPILRLPDVAVMVTVPGVVVDRMMANALPEKADRTFLEKGAPGAAVRVMRPWSRVTSLPLIAFALVTAASCASSGPGGQVTGTGGATGSGGNVGAGGTTTGSGGAVTGAGGFAGAVGAGGTPATGGATGTGGMGGAGDQAAWFARRPRRPAPRSRSMRRA